MSVRHGGNIDEAALEFSVPKENWIDLSTGINPYAYPLENLSERIWQVLPEKGALEALKEAATQCYGLAKAEHVLPVAGTQALLQVLPHLFEKPKRVRVLGPTYKEHAACWARAGHDVREIDDLVKARQDSDILIIVSPNNPTGRIIAPEMLLELAQEKAQQDGLLIVDGAFMDVDPQSDISSWTGLKGLMILRSFGKFYGLAGLRLGFALCEGEINERLTHGLGPWSVSGPALEIGRRALLDRDWQNKTKAELANRAARLDDILNQNSVTVKGGCSLFRFCKLKGVNDFYRFMGREGVLIRTFDDVADHVRIGLPGNERDWQKLADVLEKWKKIA